MDALQNKQELTAQLSMQRTLCARGYQLLSDLWLSFSPEGPKTRQIFNRKYMAAWRTFHDFDPVSVKVLVDIGAHDGLYAKYAAQYFSLERTILIEPLPEKSEILHDLNVSGKVVIMAALADRVGTAQIHNQFNTTGFLDQKGEHEPWCGVWVGFY